MDTVKHCLSRLKEKGLRYWLVAFVVFILALTGSSYVYEYLDLTSARSKYFQLLLDWGPRPSEPQWVKLILIDDDDYWYGQPAGRRPIKRDYLAAIVDKLTKANANVIALDFDTRLPDPNSKNIPIDYQEETRILVDAIKRAALSEVKVVLSTPIWTNAQDEYITESDIYRASGLCANGRDVPDTGTKAVQENVTCGYISVPDDPLVVPLQISMADGSRLDSFALAVSRAINPQLIDAFLQRIGTSTRYGNYIPNEKFMNSNSTFSAHNILLLDSQSLNKALRGRNVIVGGHWHTFAAGRGDFVDEHWTPLGPIVGAELQANFVEDLVDRRTFGVSPARFLHGTEVLLGVLAAITFALIKTFWGKLLGVLCALLILLLLQWLVLFLFGVFFDAFVPIVGLGLHALYERLVGGESSEVAAEAH